MIAMIGTHKLPFYESKTTMTTHDEKTNSFTAEEQAEIDWFCAMHGSDVTATDEDGRSLIHKAKYGDRTVIRFLVSRGADVRAKDKNDQIPLHLAAKCGNYSVNEKLVSKGADIHAKDNAGNTPLHNAAYGGNDAIAELLISHGADVHAKNNDGWTPLHSATKDWTYGIQVAKLLVSHGADVHAKDKNGKTPLDIARERNNPRVIEYLSGLSAVPENES